MAYFLLNTPFIYRYGVSSLILIFIKRDAMLQQLNWSESYVELDFVTDSVAVMRLSRVTSNYTGLKI